MAQKTKHKKRGSTSMLVIMLIIFIALVGVVIFWPVDSSAADAVPQSSSEQDDVAATTLIHEGDVAPDFTVTMLDGSEVTLSELRGNVVMVNFWATWCPPCRQEMAHMQEGIIDRFEGSEFVVLPISRGEERETVVNFLDKMGYEFAVGLDPEQAIYKLYATNYIPRTFIINKEGVVCYVAVGYDSEVANEMVAAIEVALK